MHRCQAGPLCLHAAPHPRRLALAPILCVFEESTPLASKHVHGLSALCSQRSWKTCVSVLIPFPPFLLSLQTTEVQLRPIFTRLQGTSTWLNPAEFSVLIIFQRLSAALTTPAFLKPCPLGPSSDNPSGSPSTLQLFDLSLLPRFILLYPAFKCWLFSKLRSSSLCPLSVEEYILAVASVTMDLLAMFRIILQPSL